MTRLPLLTRSSFLPLFLTASLALAAAAVGCGSSTPALSKNDGGSAGTKGTGSSGKTGTAGGTGTSGATGASGMSGGAGQAGTAGTGFTKIPLGQTQCSDGIDNDNDGKIDLADPECTGPADNAEGSFATGIPGDNIDACKQDCFFDGNSGMGDDGCEWQLKCDPLSKNDKCPYDMSYATGHTKECSVSASQSDKCIMNCRKYVPNGCDCFGC
jgi:hypothetical protein